MKKTIVCLVMVLGFAQGALAADLVEGSGKDLNAAFNSVRANCYTLLNKFYKDMTYIQVITDVVTVTNEAKGGKKITAICTGNDLDD